MEQVKANPDAKAPAADFDYATIEASTEPLQPGWEIDPDSGSGGLLIAGDVIAAVRYRRRRRVPS